MLDSILITMAMVVGFGLSAIFFARKISYLTIGRNSDRIGDFKTRTLIFLKRVMAQYYLFRRPATGLMHAIVFWGFCVFVLGTINHVVEGYGGIHASIFFGTALGTAYFAVLDIVALLTGFAILVLALRRYVLRPKALTHPSNESAIIIFLIFTLMVTYFTTQAYKFMLGSFPEADYMLISNPMTAIVGYWGIPAEVGYKVSWWIHLVLVLGFAVFIPNSKHMHLVACPVNEFFSDLNPRGIQAKIEIDLESDVMPELGKSRIEQFPVHDLLDLYACVECGRCSDFCPAYLSGKNLNPKFVILDMKEHFLTNAPMLLAAKKTGKDMAEVERTNLVGDVITADRIWDCTTCYACQEMCPVGNEHPQKLLEMRRYLMMEAEAAPPETATLFRNLENQSNPWGLSRAERGAYLSEIGVKKASDDAPFDYLLWVGCSGSYDARAQKTIIAFAKLLQRAGVSFVILGEEEGCCGDPARRLGNELTFQMQATENIEIMKAYGVKKIVTTCPHGYSTLKYEYPQMGGEFEVEHSSVMLERLIREGKLKVPAGKLGSVTYHDSCYLGRMHGIYNEPRKILTASGAELVEMERNNAGSFCCGGGGGRMFLEETGGERINRLRTDMAAQTGAKTVAVACPFCLTMLDDGIKERGLEDKLKVNEICELLLSAIEKEGGK